MKKMHLLQACCILVVLVSCGGKDKNEVTFTNASFESGTLKGWDASGEAFSSNGVTFNNKDEDGQLFNQAGEFLFYGKKGGALSATGSMISEEFKLSGNGKVGFLIGAGKNYEDCYVALIDTKNKELQTRGNYEFNEVSANNVLHRVIIDGSKYIGKKVRIKIVDNDTKTDGYNYLNVDDFIINYQGVEEQVGKIYEANKYIEENKNKVGQTYRHTYHAMPPVGWGNDPNGMIWYQGKGHLFYQFNPYQANWGPMHWGHYTTTDFVKWKSESVALAPDQPYDNELGCFSGTAIEHENELYLMYTGVANNLQQQCIATSKDGVNFEKLNRNPVISAKQVPAGSSTTDFRDPKVFYKDGWYYSLIGSKTNNYGDILLYKSKDLKSFDYVGRVMNTSNPGSTDYLQLNGVYECPDFITLGGQEIMIASPQNLPKSGSDYENIHSVVYMPGNLNYQTGKYNYSQMIELDGGFDFYAAQTMTVPDGRTIMMAWMQMWDRTLVTQADNWVGAYTLPRELSFKDGRIYQSPVREIENYRTDKVQYSNQLVSQNLKLANIKGTTVELEMEINVGTSSKAGIKLFKGRQNETLVYYDKETQSVVFDRSNSGKSISGAESNRMTRSSKVSLTNGVLKLRIFLDKSSVEVFINDGYVTMTGNVYPDISDDEIEFFSIGGVSTLVNVTKYNITL